MNGPRMAPQAQIQKVNFLLMALIIQILLIQAAISKIFSPVKNFFITENKKNQEKYCIYYPSLIVENYVLRSQYIIFM